MNPLRLVIVEASELARNGLVQIIQRSEARISVVGAFANLDACRSYLRTASSLPHILLLDDASVPSKDLLPIIETLQHEYPKLAIVVLSRQLSGRYIQRLIDAQVSGFLYKEDALENLLVNGLQLVRKGHIYVSPRASSFVYFTRSHSDLPLNETDREVIWLLAQGHNIQEIAAITYLSVRTLYRIRSKIRAVLEVRTNEQIVDAARKQGLLDLPSG